MFHVEDGRLTVKTLNLAFTIIPTKNIKISGRIAPFNQLKIHLQVLKSLSVQVHFANTTKYQKSV